MTSPRRVLQWLPPQHPAWAPAPPLLRAGPWEPAVTAALSSLLPAHSCPLQLLLRSPVLGGGRVSLSSAAQPPRQLSLSPKHHRALEGSAEGTLPSLRLPPDAWHQLLEAISRGGIPTAHLHLRRPCSFHGQQGGSIPTHLALASPWGVEGQAWMEAQPLNSQPLGGKIPSPGTPGSLVGLLVTPGVFKLDPRLTPPERDSRGGETLRSAKSRGPLRGHN